MTYPATMLLPSVAVYVDGHWVADGRSPYSTDPQVLTGLVVRWGRSTVVDQPQPSTCSLTLLDTQGGTQFLDSIQLGMRLDVLADALLSTTPGPGTGVVVIDETFTSGPGNAYVGGVATIAASGGVLLVTSAGEQSASVVVPPGPREPVGGNPAAWDAIPRAAQGQTWTASVDVKLPAPFAGYSGWAVQVYPVTYDSPWDTATALAELGTRADLGNGWVRVSGEFIPPTGAWVGVQVRLWPTGPAWDELDPTTWDDLPGATGVLTNAAPDPRFTSLTNKTKSAGTAANATGAIITGAGAPGGIDTAYRGTVIADNAATANWYVGAGAVVNAPTVGDYYRAGAWVRRSLAGAMYLRLVNVNGSSTNGPVAQVAANTWTWLAAGGPITPGTTSLSVICMPGAALALTAGWTLDMTGLRVERVADAAAAAVPLTPADYFDGSTPDTPSTDYAWTGSPNASTSTATGIGVAVTWDELGRMAVDNVSLKAPATGTQRTGMVFSGRITDMVAQFDDTAGGTLVEVTGADQRAELGNRDVGDEPWVMESLGTRFTRIVTASGQPIQSRVSPTAAAYQVSWRDVDRQPAITLLSELATSADGVLWAATHPTTGPYLSLESLSDRVALYVLHEDPDGTVRIATRDASVTGAVVVDACDVLLEPVRWRHDVNDMATRVAVTWREQTLDDKGQPAPTDRTVSSVNPGLEQSIGVHRVAVGTQLCVQADATSVADAILGRTGNTAWRVSGLTWRADTTDRLNADALGRMMTLLDGTTRNGLPLLLTNVPDWSPVPDDQRDIALFLEGGAYTSQDGGWVLDLTVSSARAIGETAAWDELPAGVTPAATRTNRATNPRAVSGGATGWDVPRGWGTGGAGTASYFASATPPPGLTHNTAYRKTWSTGATSNVGSGVFIGATATTWLPATAGKTYTVSVYVRHTSAGNKIHCLKIGYTNTNATSNQSPIGGWVLGTNTTVASGLTWTRLTLTATAPTGAVAMCICADIEPGGVNWAAGNTLDATALLVEESATAGGYFDGATIDAPPLDYAWTGTADASTSTVTDTRTPDPGWRWDDFADDIRWIDLGGVAAP